MSISACIVPIIHSLFFFFNDTATTEIYTLSLHDALPISHPRLELFVGANSKHSYRLFGCTVCHQGRSMGVSFNRSAQDRKSTRLNSSHSSISYAVFCLKKKKKN